MKKITYLLILCLACNFSYAQIIYFDFDGLTGVTTTDPSDFNDDALAISTVSRGAGLVAVAEVNGFDASNWDAIDIPGAVTNNDYFEFSVTPNAGFEFSVTTIEMSIGRSGTGLSEIALRSSLDGYISNIDGIKPVVDLPGTPETFIFNVSHPSNTVAVTYRLYGYAETAFGTSRLKGSTSNDLVVYGSVASITPISCVLSDDFTGPTLNGSWTDVGGNTSIVSDQVTIGTGGVIGFDYIHQNANTAYNTALNTLSNSITWEFNMRQSRVGTAGPSGFNTTNYGAAFILGGTDSDITEGNGYAVVLGETDNVDDVRLVSYTGGLDENANLTDIISGGTDYDNEYLSIRVTYDPTTDTWELFVRNDGDLFFGSPISLDGADLVGTVINSTYTSVNLDNIAAVWKHNIAAGDTAIFDNLCISTSFDCAGSPVTWNGTNWVGGSPSNTTPAIITGNYNTSNGGSEISFSACSLTVSNGATLNISDNDYVEVENDLIVDAGCNITVQPYGAFIQNNNLGSITNNGTMSVDKITAPMDAWYEYTYWSSPVSGETISGAIVESEPSRRYIFNGQNFLDATAETGNNNATVAGQDDIDDNSNDWQQVNGATVMQPGVGYATTLTEFAYNIVPGVSNKAFRFTFEGDFHNGIYSTPVYRNDSETSDSNWNLIGNPYPSAIDADLFIAANSNLDGAIYLWSQNTAPSNVANGNENSNFSDDYAIINGASFTAGGDGLIPNRFIPSGQAFFVSLSNTAPITNVSGMINTADVIFSNSMRVFGATDNSKFFKTSNSKKSSTSVNNKLWIDLTSDNGLFNQISVAYVDGASNNDDGAYFDARKNLSALTSSILYTTIENTDKKFAIQGKATNSLNEDEVINLGFKTAIDVATLYKLSIAKLEGGFLTNNTVYIKDNLLNQLHNLSVSDYTFTSEVGEFNDRFEIVFNANALSTEDIDTKSNTLKIIELEDDHVQFTTSNSIKSVRIFDLLGRQLYNFKGQNNSETYKLSNLSSTVYIAKVTLSNGVIITKKAVKR